MLAEQMRNCGDGQTKIKPVSEKIRGDSTTDVGHDM